MSRDLRVLARALRAAVDVLEAGLAEETPQAPVVAPNSSATASTAPRGDKPAVGPADCGMNTAPVAPSNDLEDGDGDAKVRRRPGVRPAYRPQGPVDEVSAKRADQALKRAGLYPVSRRSRK